MFKYCRNFIVESVYTPVTIAPVPAIALFYLTHLTAHQEWFIVHGYIIGKHCNSLSSDMHVINVPLSRLLPMFTYDVIEKG